MRDKSFKKGTKKSTFQKKIPSKDIQKILRSLIARRSVSKRTLGLITVTQLNAQKPVTRNTWANIIKLLQELKSKSSSRTKLSGRINNLNDYE